ncbi:hypothetical protein GCK32_008866, partial [Trichostrongylus colubriformis]
MAMQDIDLGDRRELIDLIYGPQKDDITKTPSSSDQTLTLKPETVIEKRTKKEKSKKSRVSCAPCTVVLLFLLAIAAVIASGLMAYWYTRQEYEMALAALPFKTITRKNISRLTKEEEDTYEEEEPPVGPTMEELRLPDSLEPVWYNMTLKMNLPGYVMLPEGKNFTTDGNIMIKLNVKQPTSEIVLNAKDLNFPTGVNKVKILTERTITRGVRHAVADSSGMENFTTEEFESSTSPEMEKPTETVMVPVKRLELVEVGTKVKNIVYNSTLEKVSLILDGSLEAGSSVILQIRVYSRPEAINSTQLALDTSAKVFEFLQEYFAVPPRSTKLDVFALPELAKRAMYGDGLILVREDRLLFNSKINSNEEKLKIVQTICHEFTKQWFGNLMGKSDSRALWLNEAMAKYMEYVCLESVFTGLDKNSYQTAQSMEQALVNDARSLSHPLVFNEEGPSESNLMEDEITSDKGAALLRMLRAVIGEEKFQRGIQDFLKSHHANENEQVNLWDAWNHLVPENLESWNGEKLNISDFVDNWVKQMGYPVVEVYRIDDNTVELTQKRFKLDHLTPEKAKYRNALYWYKWDVPIFYEINGKPQTMTWLHEAIRLPLNTSDTILINTESLGYYRINYDEEGWATIVRQLKNDHKKYSPSARARIISDALALADAGQLPYETALGVISYLPKEVDMLPWSAAVTALKNLYSHLADSELEESSRTFVLNKLAAIFKSIDFGSLNFGDGNDFLESDTKRKIAEFYCELLPDVCTRSLTQQFEKNLLGPCGNASIASVCSNVPVRGRSMVYCAGVAQGGDMEFDRIRELSRREIDTAERIRLIEALACSRDPRKLRMH